MEIITGCSHLPERASDLGPHGVNVVIQGLKREDLELRLVIGKERQHARRCDETRHICELSKELEGQSLGWLEIARVSWYLG